MNLHQLPPHWRTLNLKILGWLLLTEQTEQQLARRTHGTDLSESLLQLGREGFIRQRGLKYIHPEMKRTPYRITEAGSKAARHILSGTAISTLNILPCSMPVSTISSISPLLDEPHTITGLGVGLPVKAKRELRQWVLQLEGCGIISRKTNWANSPLLLTRLGRSLFVNEQSKKGHHAPPASKMS